MSNYDIFSVLKEFGLNDQEAKIYLSGLGIGAQPASIIAKKTGIKRSHCYNVISGLITKRIMQEFTKDRVRFFNSRPPSTIAGILDHRREEIESQKEKLLKVLPEFEKIQNPNVVQPKIFFFQGLEGMKEIYEDTLKTKAKNIYGFGDFDYFFPQQNFTDFNEWLWKYTVRRARKKIKYHGILNKSKGSDIAFKHRKTQNRVLKMIENVYLPIEINIYGNKVAIVSIFSDIVGIIIEEPSIAESLRNLHKAFWDLLPDYK